MALPICLISLVGLMVDIWFIKTEYAGKMAKATLLKGIASLFFVLLGAFCYLNQPSSFGKLILIGLILGMVGDIFLNLRNQFTGGASMKVFAVGILAFLSGHFLYIAALIQRSAAIVPLALILTVVIAVLSIPQLMKRVTAPNMGLKIFGYVYLVIVIAMFSSATALWVKTATEALTVVFSIGALLFMVSDFIMIYYTFGRKIKPLRAINLLCYYVGQLMIACCILLI